MPVAGALVAPQDYGDRPLKVLLRLVAKLMARIVQQHVLPIEPEVGPVNYDLLQQFGG